MTRFVTALLLVLSSSAAALASGRAVEIGYVESFDRAADAYAIVTDGVPKKVAILAPILNGDVVEVKDPSASITLRLVGRDDPVIISQANQTTPITAEVPEKSFWSGLFRLDQRLRRGVRRGTARAGLRLDPRRRREGVRPCRCLAEPADAGRRQAGARYRMALAAYRRDPNPQEGWARSSQKDARSGGLWADARRSTGRPALIGSKLLPAATRCARR